MRATPCVLDEVQHANTTHRIRASPRLRGRWKGYRFGPRHRAAQVGYPLGHRGPRRDVGGHMLERGRGLYGRFVTLASLPAGCYLAAALALMPATYLGERPCDAAAGLAALCPHRARRDLAAATLRFQRPGTGSGPRRRRRRRRRAICRRGGRAICVVRRRLDMHRRKGLGDRPGPTPGTLTFAGVGRVTMGATLGSALGALGAVSLASVAIAAAGASACAICWGICTPSTLTRPRSD